MSQESFSSADNVTVHVSVTLCESLDRSQGSLRGKLPPRLVRGCILLDPSPPPEITVGTLSNITIHLKSPISRSPWNMCLTKIWLQDFPRNLSTDDNTASLEFPPENYRSITLRPNQVLLPSQSPFGQNAGSENTNTQSLRSSEKSVNGDFGETTGCTGEISSLLDYSIRSLVLRQPGRCTEGLSESRSANSFSLAEVAPLAFRPGYFDVSYTKFRGVRDLKFVC